MDKRPPVIDIHTHVAPFPDAPGTVEDGTVQLALEVMNLNGLSHMVDLDGGFGERLRKNLATYHRLARDRFVVFANLDLSQVNHPDFSKRSLEDLEVAAALGASGLKIFKTLGLSLRDTQGRLIRFDDPRFDPVWVKCGELGFPILFHVGDPAAFFKPPTPDNERHAELSVHPEWSFFGADFPPREALLTQMVNVLLRHPETQFIGAHFGNNPESPRYVAAVLKRCDNFHIDIAARLGEIGRHDPVELRRFFIDFQDRILFGTDIMFIEGNIELGVPMPGRRSEQDSLPFYESHWKFLETEAQELDHPCPIQGDWKIKAINLPREVLAKIYAENARRLLSQVR